MLAMRNLNLISVQSWTYLRKFRVRTIGRLFKQSLDNVYESYGLTHVETMSADYLNIIFP